MFDELPRQRKKNETVLAKKMAADHKRCSWYSRRLVQQVHHHHQAHLSHPPAMPSLRRSVSSPIVRSSPYPTALSSSSAGLRNGGHGRRRASGSETSSRRVLGDLDWWRVAEGQHDSEEDSTTPVDEQPSPPSVIFHEAAVEESFVSPQWTPPTADIALPMPPTLLFSSLSITPTTPPRRRREASGSSSSSLASTPEVPSTPVDFDFQFTTNLEQALRPSLARCSPPRRSKTLNDIPQINFNPENIFGGYADFSISPFSSNYPDLFN